VPLDEKVSNLDNRLSIMESKMDEHSKILNAQIEKNETLVRIETLMARQIDDSQKRDQQMEKFESTLLKVNENLTNLNNSQQKLGEHQEKLGERVSSIENAIEDTKKNRIKTIINSLKYIGTLLVGFGIAYLYKKLGL
jgi:chromosome segregation ATPase